MKIKGFASPPPSAALAAADTTTDPDDSRQLREGIELLESRREWKDWPLLPDVCCSVCDGPVRRVPGGTCCEEGHGGAPLVARPSVTARAAADALTAEAQARGEYSQPVYEKEAIYYGQRRFVRVFQEDECLRNDPTATKIQHAFSGFTGASFADTKPDVRWDEGDSITELYGELGAIVCTSFDGSSLYLDDTRMPYAARFGSSWEFDTWRRVADGFRSMRDPDPRYSATYRLVALGDYANAIAGVFQNNHPMTEAEHQEALRLLADFGKQIPNIVDELSRLKMRAERELADAKRG